MAKLIDWKMVPEPACEALSCSPREGGAQYCMDLIHSWCVRRRYEANAWLADDLCTVPQSLGLGHGLSTPQMANENRPQCARR